MTNLDQFESVFKSAAKTPYEFQQIDIKRVLVVTDMQDGTSEYVEQVKHFLQVLNQRQVPEYQSLAGDEFSTVGKLLDLVEQAKPDLVVTYRNLHSSAWKWPYSLGSVVDVLTQVSSAPVLLLPHPKTNADGNNYLKNTDVVMAITDHLTGDDRLVNYAAEFTTAGGDLWLTHVEDGATLAKFIDVISKIPELDTETAETTLADQLLKEPSDYIRSCQEPLSEAGAGITVQASVTLGHFLRDYLRLIAEHQVDLLVLNTKDDDQLAMHGLAYPLAIELGDTPLLML